MKLKVTSFLFLALATTSAWAMDQSVTPEKQKYFSSGFGIGASIGFGAACGNLQSTWALPPYNYSVAPRATVHSSNVVGGVLVDYQKVMDSGWSWGGEVAFSFDAINLKNSFAGQVPAAGPRRALNYTIKTEFKRSCAIEPSIVIGKTISERWRLFGKVGPSIASFNVRQTLTSQGLPPAVQSFKERKTGVVVAVGADCALAKNISLTASVSYTQYPKITRVLAPVVANPPVAGERFGVSLGYSVITPKLGVTCRF